MARPPKDTKSKAMSTTFGKLEQQSPSNSSNNDKLINDMLKDLDNNHKFSVGNKRAQTRYEG